MSLLVGTDGGGSSCWTGNISSLNIITRQARMDNTDQSEDSPNQADQWRTNESTVQCNAEHLLDKRVERNRIMNRFQQKPAITV